MRISAALITRDAGPALARCLASLDFVDEIVVLDQGSRDGTEEVCRRHGARLHQGEFQGFGRTKAAAVALCRNRWILSVDSDEVVSPELRAAILALPDDPGCAAFAVNRLSRFLGRWIRHGGWHPEWVVRLFDRERARFDERPVHESVVTDEPVRRLDGLLLHHTYDTLEEYLERLNRYTSLAAEEAHAAGRRAGVLQAVIRAKFAFLRMYALRAGFLDGWQGLVLSACSAFYVLTKYVKLWRMGRS
jgi:glycosyltransferase involved in cell wall biosynthesis